MPILKSRASRQTVVESSKKEAQKEDKPLPENPRPGTSGTENLLMTNRRRASENYQKAARAEKAYRAKKRASAARRDFKDARGHYKEAFHHLKAALRMTFSSIKTVPYILGEKREQARLKSDEKRRKRALENKKKLEERLAMEAADVESTRDSTEAAKAS